MLKLQNITKVYGGKKNQAKVTALKGISLEFRASEFVAILGPSGCGKTSTLNIIGGLDSYTDGDLLIDGTSTKNFTDKDWDAYRNNAIGFVFQNYNLISHQTVLQNVEIALNLSGVSAAERKERATKVLQDVGLGDKLNQLPSQLSGGQMQRVAIARALVNDPKIVLADEPTGALDSTTSVQIMELLSEIAKDRLVIMVTHNPKIASEYATRIVEFFDGELVSDSNPVATVATKKKGLTFTKTSMSLAAALRLSLKNLMTKRGRTVTTAFAGSIGIIGVGLVLALVNGLTGVMTNMQQETLANFPLTITNGQTMTPDGMMDNGTVVELEPFSDELDVHRFTATEEMRPHENVITEDFVAHVEALDPNLILAVTHTYDVDLNVVSRLGGTPHQVELAPVMMDDGPMDMALPAPSVMQQLPNEAFILNLYDVLIGRMPQAYNEVILVVNSYNYIGDELFEALGFEASLEATPMQGFLGESKLSVSTSAFSDSASEDFDAGIQLDVVGVIRRNPDAMSGFFLPGFVYTSELLEHLVPNGEVPVGISIFPVNFDATPDITEHLASFNEGLDEADHIVYLNMSEMIVDVVGTMITTVSLVLIGFASISLIVSAVMIGIITYVSVIERTKEIGILRSVGARKKDISRLFRAETMIIGFTAGAIGVIVAYLLSLPINNLVENMAGIGGVASLSLTSAVMLIVGSMLLTMFAGISPSRKAAKKDPVEALRV